MKARSALAALLIISAAGCGVAEDAPARGEISEAEVLSELTRRRADYVDALKGSDGQAVASFWTSGAKIREPGVKMDGAAAVEKFARDFFAKGKVEALEMRPEDVFVHGDAAYEFGAYDESGTDGGKAFQLRNYYALKWQRGQDGDWRMAALLVAPREPTR